LQKTLNTANARIAELTAQQQRHASETSDSNKVAERKTSLHLVAVRRLEELTAKTSEEQTQLKVENKKVDDDLKQLRLDHAKLQSERDELKKQGQRNQLAASKLKKVEEDHKCAEEKADKALALAADYQRATCALVTEKQGQLKLQASTTGTSVVGASGSAVLGAVAAATSDFGVSLKRKETSSVDASATSIAGGGGGVADSVGAEDSQKTDRPTKTARLESKEALPPTASDIPGITGGASSPGGLNSVQIIADEDSPPPLAGSPQS